MTSDGHDVGSQPESTMKPVQMFRTFLHQSSGATAIEYGLIAVLIALVIVVGATQTGEATKTPLETVGTAISTANATD